MNSTNTIYRSTRALLKMDPQGVYENRSSARARAVARFWLARRRLVRAGARHQHWHAEQHAAHLRQPSRAHRTEPIAHSSRRSSVQLSPFLPHAHNPAAVLLLHTECPSTKLRCQSCPPPPQPRRARLRQPHPQLVVPQGPPRAARGCPRYDSKINTDQTPVNTGNAGQKLHTTASIFTSILQSSNRSILGLLTAGGPRGNWYCHQLYLQ
eukprot:COSAG02_NODE_495_length_21151_cov_31.954256_16_plen_210_part_00